MAKLPPDQQPRGGLVRRYVSLQNRCATIHKGQFSMGLVRILLVWMGGVALAGVSARPQAPPQPPSKTPVSTTLVLAGGTVVDVTDWGHSAKDLLDAVVIVRDGRIADVGSRAARAIPKGARVIDCTGKYLIPGLVDGFAGMNEPGPGQRQSLHGRDYRGGQRRRSSRAHRFCRQSQPPPLPRGFHRDNRQLEPAVQPPGVGSQAAGGLPSRRIEPGGHCPPAHRNRAAGDARSPAGP